MKTKFDIIVVGAGPAGLSFCRSLANTSLNIAIIDTNDLKTLANPPFDGREIALTHPSKSLLESLDIWQKFPSDEIYPLREAKVINGDSDYLLHFPTPPVNSVGEKIDTLGYLVSNHNIRRACYEVVKNQENITWFLGCSVKLSENKGSEVAVTFENNETIRASLLVAADGRMSRTRSQMGIPTNLHDFSRTVIVFRLKHEIPNDHTAYECFFYGSTLAVLPLTDNMVNCVVTIKTSELSSFLALDATALAQKIQSEIQNKLGHMELVSEVIKYPLVGVHAERFYADRCALIGDAACGMHPVTAHGFNLGLQSQKILSSLILKEYAQGKSIATQRLLSSYSMRHRKNTIPLYYGTNFVVNLFTNDEPLAKFARKRLLKISNKISPLKKLITKQLTG